MTQIELTPTASLIGKWKPYSAYKDSGVEWLGKIPAHWNAVCLKYLARLNYGDSLPADVRQVGEVPVFGSNGPVGFHSQPNTLRPVLIIGRKGSFGKINYSDQPCFAIDTTYYIDARNSRSDLRWLFYALLLLRLDAISEDSAIPGLSRELAHYQRLPSISLPEQRAIAAFLDRETVRINALIEKKERLIELLQEKRAAIISHAVTKGLDPTVPMKDSGVEWLGEIPAHWEVKRVRDITELLQTGPFGSQLHSSDYSPYGIPVINPSHLKDGHIYPDWDCAVNEETYSRLVRHELRKGDIVFARRGQMGRCALVTEKEAGWLCGTGSLLMRPRITLSVPSFLSKVLSTNGVRDWLLLESVGSTMDNLNTSILSRIPLPIPILSEQQAIVSYLDSQTAKIDALISRIQEGIEKLKEYSTALISAAVTGKIDVRGEISMQGSEM